MISNGLAMLATTHVAPPSDYAITALVEDEPGAIGRVLWLTAWRAVPIAVGLYLVGDRQNLAKKSLGASTSLTVVLYGYILGRKKGWWT